MFVCTSEKRVTYGHFSVPSSDCYSQNGIYIRNSAYCIQWLKLRSEFTCVNLTYRTYFPCTKSGSLAIQASKPEVPDQRRFLITSRIFDYWIKVPDQHHTAIKQVRIHYIVTVDDSGKGCKHVWYPVYSSIVLAAYSM